ncbi:hypothetical protein P153DRAFT_376644 [Dothidotthia symphoricarpi CBS 119687]|uniref:DH domain-containing protein n=1 Tax=Dothidotthia symphoricarpi CBS 119687 TaxID=1392245 RepID=A0A6A6ABY2_9PLEO|nr:uncharacterized protein P153DRAFT_376644 [Dothidotthia symphoricarpi CBS 119687]KAF2128514.1 hypothetical protein P153DRAFT_376644 [Dothidotthia symphoricarpi CBS 119687]
MEPVSALFGVMAAIPQCIQSAKSLYDLRSRYKDASILITAIYSESMVIAASLSQVQNLLQHDALQNKPQLLETFDRALTGCRVVYGCLEEEVRDLVVKAEEDDLKFKDRAKFLWKEDTFKELLQQIRGQQSALSLLIQGLQMESIADIRLLVEANSSKLDQVVKRSRTLRQSHPRIQVPDSLFSHTYSKEDAADADSIIKSTEFSFDDEVINSKAYRRAMAMYASQTGNKAPPSLEKDILDDDLDASTIKNEIVDYEKDPVVQTASEDVRITADEEHSPEVTDAQSDALDSIEHAVLPYMPRMTSTAPYLTSRVGIVNVPKERSNSTPLPTLSRPNREEFQAIVKSTPPLPPRRPSGQQLRTQGFVNPTPKARSASSDSVLTPGTPLSTSTTSSYTIYEYSDQNVNTSRRPVRKPLPLVHKASHDILGSIRIPSYVSEPSMMVSSPRSTEMHDIWTSLIDCEQKFIERMTKLRTIFYDKVIREWPLLEKHLEAILIGAQLASMNKDILLGCMELQVSKADNSIFDPSLFENWTSKIQKTYREYCQAMPHTAESLRATQNADLKFSPFVNTLGLSIISFGMGWEDYLSLPLSQLEVYRNKLQNMLDASLSLDSSTAEKGTARIEKALDAVKGLQSLSHSLLEEAQSREDIQNLERRLTTMDSDYLSRLRLLNPARRVRHQGVMAMKLRSQGQWISIHVVLFDNFLLWGKLKTQRKNKEENIMVLEAPIPLDELEINLPCDQHQFQKASFFDDIPRGSVLYLILIKNKSASGKPHLLGSYGYQERTEWMQHFTAATAVTT